MRVGECCKRDVVTAGPDTTIEQAARLMRMHHAGAIVVVSGGNGSRQPAGIVTDRDLVVEGLAGETPIALLTLGAIMNADLLTAGADDGLWETLERMSVRGVRRMPVVGPGNVLEGILCVDDVAQLLVEAQSRMVRLMHNERAAERLTRPSGVALANPAPAEERTPAETQSGPVAEWACGETWERRVARLTRVRNQAEQAPSPLSP